MDEEIGTREATIEEMAAKVRMDILETARTVELIMNHKSFRDEDQVLTSPNIPSSRKANMKANITLAFRHLEDARMRLGKVMQAYQGGTSILEK